MKPSDKQRLVDAHVQSSGSASGLLVRPCIHGLIDMEQFVSVQPMSRPCGLDFYIQYTYGSGSI